MLTGLNWDLAANTVCQGTTREVQTRDFSLGHVYFRIGVPASHALFCLHEWVEHIAFCKKTVVLGCPKIFK